MSALRRIDPAAVAAPASVSPGAAPMLQWIEVSQLLVDDTYQRAPNLKVIARIAQAFDWRKFSTVLVAPVEGGLFAVIDGQHRSHAAAACGIEKVPCQVTIMDRAEQAQAFAAINGIATRVHPNNLFKAAIAAGEAWAIEVRDVCQEAGCRALTYPKSKDQNRRPGEILAVGFVRDAIQRRGREKVAAALGILRRSQGLGDQIDAYDNGIIRPVVEALTSRPHLLDRGDEVSAAMEEIDVFSLQDRAGRMAVARRQAGQPTMGKAELLESLVGDALDRALPQRMAAPAAAPQRHEARPAP